MCFSAGASFSAAGVLSIISLLSIKQVRDKRLYSLALVPLAFAAQQFSEGVLWLALEKTISPIFINPAAYIFLFFALFLWPLYIPISALLYEKNGMRRNLLYIPASIGLLFTSVVLYYLGAYGIQAECVSCHILYSVKDISFSNYALIPYLIATIAPFFISSIQNIWIFGLMLLAAFLISFVVYTAFLTSVWCFFAALLSMLLYWIIKTENRPLSFD